MTSHDHSYTEQVLDFPDSTQQYHKCKIRLLNQGLPVQSEIDGTEPDMCVPIYPATANPLLRPPLRTSAFLPWDNCYHHSAMHIVAALTIQSDHVPNSEGTVTTISFDDMFEHDFYVQEDEERRQSLRAARLRTNLEPGLCIPKTGNLVSSLVDGTPSEARAATCVSSNGPSERLGEPSPLHQILDPLYESLFDNESDVGIPGVACCVAGYDLSTTGELANPAGLLREIAQMVRLRPFPLQSTLEA